MIRWLATICLSLSVCVLHAAELRGLAVSVADGDTITVLDSANQQHRIRLAGIDAPEKGQPFADRSRLHLAKYVRGQEVIVNWHKRDRYGRLVGSVIAFGHNINLEQVRAGFAWWYREYAREQRPEDRQVYERAEEEARAARRGLWSEANPTPPWEWRSKRRDPTAD